MQNTFKNVVFTNHALARLRERQISQSDAWYTLKHSDQQIKQKNGAWKFVKKYGRQEIAVVAKKNQRNQWVVLSCWSKIKGTGKPIFKKESLIERIIKRLLG